jgi:hypothetical protein
MRNFLLKHREHWTKQSYRHSIYLALVFFIASLFINHLASDYVDLHAGGYVPDIILDNVKVFDVDGILNYGALLLVIFIVGFLGHEPKRAPFVIKSVALFIVIRATFITLTRLGPSPITTPINPNNLMSQLIMGKDFFFSGHTGLPFLLSLIFWDHKLARGLTLAASLIFGLAVLLGHLHYSIDVFSAFFISYSIYHLARYFFATDYRNSH